jgi:hypothetical protein
MISGDFQKELMLRVGEPSHAPSVYEKQTIDWEAMRVRAQWTAELDSKDFFSRGFYDGYTNYDVWGSL